MSHPARSDQHHRPPCGRDSLCLRIRPSRSCCNSSILAQVPAFLEGADLSKKLARTAVAARDILDQAHEQAVFFGEVGNDRWDLFLSQRDERLEPALAVDQPVLGVAS